MLVNTFGRRAFNGVPERKGGVGSARRYGTWCPVAVASMVLCTHCGSAQPWNEDSTQEGLAVEQTRSAVVTEIQSLLGRLTLAEKAGQMVQIEFLNLQAALESGSNPVTELNLGSVFSGGNSLPKDNTPRGWQEVYDRIQGYARRSSSGIPIIYGIDAVHGHNAIPGATIFPHNIGLGATRDPNLVEQVQTVTAKEVTATGLDWTFGPCVAVTRDERWGRAYESFGETPQLQTLLAGPAVFGLQGASARDPYIIGTAKHFIGDGGTLWGTSGARQDGSEAAGEPVPQIDRGNTVLDLRALKDVHAKGYEEAIKAGIGTIMVSYNSVNGVKMSENKQLVTGYLKADTTQGGLGFKGVFVSDWNSVEEISTPGIEDLLAKYKEQVIKAVDTGIDMFMIEGKIQGSYKYALVHKFIQEGVREGRLSQSRINDAVTRILTLKMKAGIFDKYRSDGQLRAKSKGVRDTMTAEFGSADHRDVARQAVRESLVLLKNDKHALPLVPSRYDNIYVAGKNAHNYGAQCGGWTQGWQGTDGNLLKSDKDRTILEGIQAAAGQQGMRVSYAKAGVFPASKDAAKGRSVAVAVLGERPYAEYFGDEDDLSLDAEDQATLANVYKLNVPVVVVLVSGRPRLVAREIGKWDAFIAAWLPGSQGEGVADVLVGDYDFVGKLPITWPKSMTDLPINAGDGKQGLFEYGFGLQY